MLLEKLRQDIAQSLKQRGMSRLETLRFLLAAVQNAAIAKYGANAESNLTDDDVVGVIRKQVKSHEESIEAFTKAGRTDLVDKEKSQLAILKSYLPQEISDEELKKILAPVMAGGETNFGLLMKQAMSAVAGKAEGGRVATLLKQMLRN